MNLEQIKKESFKVKWNLRSVYKVTQWKEGCVYKTKSLGLIICAPGYQFLDKDIQLGSCPTNITKQLL